MQEELSKNTGNRYVPIQGIEQGEVKATASDNKIIGNCNELESGRPLTDGNSKMLRH